MAKTNSTPQQPSAERDPAPHADTPQPTSAQTPESDSAAPPQATAPEPPAVGDAQEPAELTDADTVADTEAESDELAALSPQQLMERLQQSQAEQAEIKDGLLRAKAETENIRRRSQKEIVAARKFAIEGFAAELLGVKDSLEQAAQVELEAGGDDAVRQMKEGLGLTLKQLDLAMAKFSVVEVEAAPGVRFDPQCHQAISTAPSEEFDADHIVSVVQKGFLLKERLLRPAMVVVAKAGGDGKT